MRIQHSLPYLIMIFLLLNGVTSTVHAQQKTSESLRDTSEHKQPSVQTKEESAIFQKVDIEASVDMAQWRRHLEMRLQPAIEKAATKGMKPGQYTVNVRFLVEKNGTISDVKALNDPGYDLAKGAVNVVKTGPLWSAGEINGRKVRSYHTQPIIFVIQEM